MVQTLQMGIRPPAVAGAFYPAGAGELRRMVATLLAEARPPAIVPKALIVPHAGYEYSGAIAASGYRLLESIRDKIERVVLVGPSHHIPFYGVATTSLDEFATPLGGVPIDQAAVRIALRYPYVQVLDEAHRREHSLEVQLPFLQATLTEFSLAPFAVGRVGTSEVAELLDALWGGDETLIVVSSDLSHYHDYRSARAMDRETTTYIEHGQWQRLSGERACGYCGVSALLKVAQQRELNVKTLDLRNSGDTAGPKDEVVGYGAYAVY